MKPHQKGLLPPTKHPTVQVEVKVTRATKGRKAIAMVIVVVVVETEGMTGRVSGDGESQGDEMLCW